MSPAGKRLFARLPSSFTTRTPDIEQVDLGSFRKVDAVGGR